MRSEITKSSYFIEAQDCDSLDLRAAVHQIADDVEAMRHMNILLRAGQAEKIMQKTVAWMLAVVDRLESLEARKKL